jgi:hypothetical protein
LRVYVSGPFTQGHRWVNIQHAIAAADELLCAGHVPWVPHLTHWWDQLFLHEYEEWMQYDLAWLAQCEALIRLPGFSPGGDREVQRAKQLGIQVFHGVDTFLAWASRQSSSGS